MKELRGTGIALITPFMVDRSIDFSDLERFVKRRIEGCVYYLVCLGITSETPTLTNSEKSDILQAIKSANSGRLPMVLGIGGNNTEAVKDEFKSANLDDYFAILSDRKSVM